MLLIFYAAILNSGIFNSIWLMAKGDTREAKTEKLTGFWVIPKKNRRILRNILN